MRYPRLGIVGGSCRRLVFSGRFDLSKTYLLIAGVAGVDPACGTLGSAHWARYAIDGGLHNEIDAREAPGQSAAESLAARSGGYLPAVADAYRVGGALAHAIPADWDTWGRGPPK